jgi:uncharacterized protein
MDAFQPPNLQRIQALDVARGIAVLGILLINIYSFALPEVMRGNPLLMAEVSWLDRVIWNLLHVFADTKFLTVLTVVFGASLWFFALHKSSDDPALANQLQFRRSIWLLVFGLLHSYLLWDGDILFTYAVCALIAWQWRFWSDRRLLTIGVALSLFMGIFNLLIGFIPGVMDGIAASQTPEMIEEEIALYQQDWVTLASARIISAMDLQIGVIFSGWATLALMLIGMVLARRGLLSLQASAGTYRKLIAATFVSGLLLVAMGLEQSIQHEFAVSYVYGWGYLLHSLGSTLMGIAYLLMIICWCNAGGGIALQRVFASVGRMALSLYIMQSLVCTFLFNGYGLGLYGRLSLSHIMLVIVCIWIFQCAFACWWLARFHIGPLEWLWRRLAYQNPLVPRS